MIAWELSHNEIDQIKGLLSKELRRKQDVLRNSTDEKRRESADTRRKELGRLLKSLEQAAEPTADILCYCDTNYDFYSQTLSIHYRIGGDKIITRSVIENMPPPPDEYYGIIALLQDLKQRGTKGSVLVLIDASRCALALQKGMLYAVPRHTNNQAPRKKDFTGMYPTALALVKELDALGCRVEFRYKNRVFINDVLGISP